MSSQYERENIYEVPWPAARARVPRRDAVRTGGLGTKANPRNHTILGFLGRKLKCYLNQQVTCILEIYILINQPNAKYGVLRKLKHIFPNTYQRIKSICSPAKGGTGCYRFNYQPGS